MVTRNRIMDSRPSFGTPRPKPTPKPGDRRPSLDYQSEPASPESLKEYLRRNPVKPGGMPPLAPEPQGTPLDDLINNPELFKTPTPGAGKLPELGLNKIPAYGPPANAPGQDVMQASSSGDYLNSPDWFQTNPREIKPAGWNVAKSLPMEPQDEDQRMLEMMREYGPEPGEITPAETAAAGRSKLREKLSPGATRVPKWSELPQSPTPTPKPYDEQLMEELLGRKGR